MPCHTGPHRPQGWPGGRMRGKCRQEPSFHGKQEIGQARIGLSTLYHFNGLLQRLCRGCPQLCGTWSWGSWGQTEYENFLSCHTGILFLLVVVQSPTQARHCSLMDCSTPGLPVCPSPSPEVCPSSCSCTCDAISFSDALFSFCPQSFPASGTFLMSCSHQMTKILELQLQHQSFQ